MVAYYANAIAHHFSAPMAKGAGKPVTERGTPVGKRAAG
jgi:hypothetical protein